MYRSLLNCSFGFLIFQLLWVGSFGDDVLGCNGFVKSDISINYSDVEVKLFTKQGSLKDHTECAPNNGYYFLPLYDKGEYILKVVPPDGWTFEPSEVLLSVDGVSDSCSQGKDINFEFKGFAVNGKVISVGSKIGPKGVSVELYGEDTNNPVLHTFTSVGGDFIFTPVLPGNYRVKISHPVWKMDKTETTVLVLKNNGIIPEGSLSVVGYDVSGSVTSDNQPIMGVSFILFAKGQVKVTDCDKSSLPGFSSEGLGLEGFSQVCHVSSSAKGVFTFPVLPLGDYVLVPHYKGSKSTKFDVHPRKLPFTVSHSSVVLPTAFQILPSYMECFTHANGTEYCEVKGFTVSGKVLWSQNGLPLPNAVVYLNGKEVTKTAEDGSYNLESMRAGSYKMKVVAENIIFEETDVKVTSTSLPDMFPISYRVTGSLYSTTSSGPYRLKVFSNSVLVEQLTTGADGKYSVYLKPGKYSLSPAVEDTQRNEGLLFSPSSRELEVSNKPVDRVDFSQLRAVVKGRLSCMTACPPITVNLKPKGRGALKQTTTQKGGQYEFTNIMPGDYDIYIEPGLGWCWDRETMPLSVMKEVTEVPNFVQSGFSVTISSTHETKVNYWPEGNEKAKQEMTVAPGSTHICVPKSSPYIFEPVGCHGYRSARVRWQSGSVVELAALTHANTFFIDSNHPIDDLVVAVKSRTRNPNFEGGSVVPVKVTSGEKKPGVWRYEVTMQLANGEMVTISPTAGISLFTPQQLQLKGALDCQNISKPLFRAEKGQVITGKVTAGDNKGLGGVSISILDEDGTALHTQLTKPDGSYKFPPIKATTNYRLLAAKEGYVLTEQSTKGHFSAHKLAEIIVAVKDKDNGTPLQGVLLSMSGGKDYRRNAQTDTGGVMSFLSLSPGEYFLRPMMKEYKFDPPSKIISVNEGATVELTLSGKRVAYSCHGEVTSLNGEGEGGVVVEAVGLGTCNLYQEEATSASSGQFRIRGLQPGCEYNIHVKQGIDVNQHVAKATPENITIKIEEADVNGLRLYALKPEWRTDVMVHVLPERPEDLRTLRVKLCAEESPDTIIHTVRLADYKPSSSGYALHNIIVPLPPLPADGKTYIAKLESTLSQATHLYTNRPVHFKANSGLKVIRLTFAPVGRTKEPELSQSSYIILPGILILAAIVYNKERAVGLVSMIVQARLLTRTYQSEDSGSDTFLDNSLPKKTKAKSRKL